MTQSEWKERARVWLTMARRTRQEAQEMICRNPSLERTPGKGHLQRFCAVGWRAGAMDRLERAALCRRRAAGESR